MSKSGPQNTDVPVDQSCCIAQTNPLTKEVSKDSANVEVYGYISDKENYLKRLKRIEGQTRGIQRMVDEEKYCIDILTQVSSITKALQAVALGLLEDHLKHCVVDAAKAGGPDADAKIKEATDAIARLLRS